MVRKIGDVTRSWVRQVLPQRLLRQIAFEARASLKSAVRRRANAKRYKKMEAVKVNVGCGDRPTTGWVNLDMISDPRIEYWDCRKGLPFSDRAVMLIYAEHFLEHLEYDDEVRTFLNDCFRCLNVKGIIRIVVPDAEAYLKLYANDDWDGLAKMRPLTREGEHYRDDWLGARYSTKMELINAVFRQGGEHKYAYDAETLIRLLQSAGFSRVSRVSFGVSSDPAMPRGQPQRQSESLYIEAAKT